MAKYGHFKRVARQEPINMKKRVNWEMNHVN